MILPKGYILRDIQKDVLDKIFNNKSNFYILNLPTGVGKSLIAETISLNYPTTVITKTKFLQEQYLKEFKFDNIKANFNYTCSLEDIPVASKRCLEIRNKNKDYCLKNCPYIVAREKFKFSKKRLTNFAYFLNSPWMEAFSTDFVIVDEAHNFGQEIINANTLELSKIFYKNFEEKFSQTGIAGVVYTDLIREFLSTLKSQQVLDADDFLMKLDELITLGFNINSESDIYKLSYSEFTLFAFVKKVFDRFNNMNHIEILKYETEDKIIVKPIYPKDLLHTWINKGDRFIFMSATIGDKDEFEKELGIENSFYYEARSPFKKENKPIIYKPLFNFTYNNKEESVKILLTLIDRIITKHKNENGIIHTPSFSLAYEIKDKSKFGYKMVIPKNPLEVKKWKNSGKIIIGPNFFEGVDFKNDEARWQIITKVPYISIEDPYIKCRLNSGWYYNETLKRLEQTIGRIVRNEKDYGVTYIFDKQFEKFIHKLPNFIKESIIKA